MKRLLRGIIDFEDGALSEENLTGNFMRLREARVAWTRPEDGKIFQFVNSFYETNIAIPSGRVVVDYFARADDVEVLERVKVVQAAESYARTNYVHILKQILDDINRKDTLALLKQTQEIVTKGTTIQEGREKKLLKGVEDAIVYFTSNAQSLLPSSLHTQTRGDVRLDAQPAWDEYQRSKKDKSKAWGKFMGIEEIDTVCHGLKRGEMWVHAAFAGELKSVMAINWAYMLVTRYRTNAFYCSFEMPYDQLRRIILVRHSANPRFAIQGKSPLDYRKVRDGELTKEEEDFYQEVLTDWDNNPEYCRFHLWCPDRDVTIQDIRTEAEILHKSIDVGFLVLDHGGLIEPRKKNTNYTVELNSVLRDAKKMALYFNHGEGVPVLMLFQINRDGKDMADKAEGKYKLRALSYANETEKSADTVTTTYLNDTHRENGTTMCCCLKNRDNPLFKPFLLGVNFSCRRIYRLTPESLTGQDMGLDGQDSMLDALMKDL